MVKPAIPSTHMITRYDQSSQASSSKAAAAQTLAYSRPSPEDAVSATLRHGLRDSSSSSSPASSSSSTSRTIVPHHIPDMLFLPRTMDAWPWKRNINPHCEAVKKEANEWFYAFHPFSPRSLMAFDRCDLGRLAALAYPTVPKEHLRTGCDLMNLFFVVDEYTDLQPASVVRTTIGIVLDALANPHADRPEGEILLGQVVKEFWLRATANSTPQAQAYFMRAFSAHLRSIIAQAEDRDKGYIRTVREYIDMRRDNIGIRPSFFPGAMSLDMPESVWEHPLVRELEHHVCDMVTLDNDVTSFNKEQASDDADCNIVTILMHQFQTDYTGAVEWIARHHAHLERSFLELARDLLWRLRRAGVSVSSRSQQQLRQYVSMLANWPRANDAWTFESGRYFGDKGLEVQETRLVKTMTKKKVELPVRQTDVTISIPMVEVQ